MRIRRYRFTAPPHNIGAPSLCDVPPNQQVQDHLHKLKNEHHNEMTNLKLELAGLQSETAVLTKKLRDKESSAPEL